MASTDAATAPRRIRVVLREERMTAGVPGLLAADPRVRTLLRALVTYPAVRHIAPDRVSLESTADPHVLDAIAGFLRRQDWLVTAVVVE